MMNKNILLLICLLFIFACSSEKQVEQRLIPNGTIVKHKISKQTGIVIQQLGYDLRTKEQIVLVRFYTNPSDKNIQLAIAGSGLLSGGDANNQNGGYFELRAKVIELTYATNKGE